MIKFTKKQKQVLAIIIFLFGGQITILTYTHLTNKPDLQVELITNEIAIHQNIKSETLKFYAWNRGFKATDPIHFFYKRIGEISNNCNENATFFYDIFTGMCNLKIDDSSPFCDASLDPLLQGIRPKIEYTLYNETNDFFSTYNISNCELIETIKICGTDDINTIGCDIKNITIIIF